MITDFEKHGDTLLAAGHFGLLDGDTVPGVMMYNNGQWIQFSDTVSAVGQVEAVTVYNGNIVIGGRQLGELKIWENGKWHLIDSSPIQGMVLDLKVIDNELWVAGVFDSIGSVEALGLARWDGQQWKSAYDVPRLNGPNNPNWFATILEYQGDIYVGGNVDVVSGLTEILKWDGQKWTDVGGGIRIDGFSGVDKLIEFRGDLYVMGRFLSATGNADNNIMRWNGEEWLPCGGGTDFTVWDGAVYDDKLWVTGQIFEAGGLPVNGIAVWDGKQWCSTGNEFNSWPTALIEYQDTLFMGGTFQTIDGDSFSFLATWTGEGDFDTCGVKWPVGIDEKNIPTDNILLYPNPTHNNTMITCNSPIQQIDIFNSQGVLTKRHFGTNALSVDLQLDGLPNGLYFLSIKTENESVTKKILKTTN